MSKNASSEDNRASTLTKNLATLVSTLFHPQHFMHQQYRYDRCLCLLLHLQYIDGLNLKVSLISKSFIKYNTVEFGAII